MKYVYKVPARTSYLAVTVAVICLCLFLTGCSSISLGSCDVEKYDLSKAKEMISTPEAKQVAASLGIDISNPVLCKSNDDCKYWQSCLTLCEAYVNNQVTKQICDIGTENTYVHAVGTEGICQDVACRDKCDANIHIAHYGCCMIGVVNE